MDGPGVLVVSKCLSAAAIVDSLLSGDRYAPKLYVAERQLNPYNLKRATSHRVIPDLNRAAVAAFAERFRGNIDFGLTDTEDFVTAWGRELLAKAGVQMLCVSRKFAVERSKAGQRALFRRIFKGANPPFRIFDPGRFRDHERAVQEFKKTMDELGPVVIKPDAPARGAGVGVWGGDFSTSDGAIAFFRNVLSKGKVLVEAVVKGEESSFHAFSDGKHFVPAPLSRDYKRSLEGNKGKLTGGMGSYRGPDDHLPFLARADYEDIVRAEEASFRKWRGRGSEPGLRGIILYDAIMHTGKGFKVLERNSRGGNTESINLYTTLEDDFIDVCHRMLDGSLKGIRFSNMASVVTCAVPLAYGIEGKAPVGGAKVDMTKAVELARKSGGDVRVYPMDVRLEGGQTLMGASRTVAVVGLGPDLEVARSRSLEACRGIAGPLRWRSDIASTQDVDRSRRHLRRLRDASSV